MRQDLHEIVDRALALSRADDCMVIAYNYSTANIRWANNTTTTNGISDLSRLYVISIIDGAVGTVGRSYFPDESLESIVRASEASCAGKPKADDFMPLVGGSTDPGWGDPPDETSMDVFSTTVPELAGLFRQGGSGGIKLFGYAEHTAQTEYLGTSTGIRRRHSQREGKFELNGKDEDFTRSSWVGKVTSDFSDISPARLYPTIEQRLGWSETQIDLDPGPYQVLLEPSCVADMAVYAYWIASRRDADEGRTVFSKPGGGNRTGEKMFADEVSLYSDPLEPGMGIAPFFATQASGRSTSLFDNGVPLQKTEWVKAGVLENLVTPRFWAARNGGDARPFMDNLIMPGDGPGLDAMIESTERGLLITCLHYIREVDPQTLLLTGLTRDGVFLIEDGRVKGATNNFRFNMSPVAMLAQTREIGTTESTLAREWGEFFSLARMPPLRVDDFFMSSVSEAT